MWVNWACRPRQASILAHLSTRDESTVAADKLNGTPAIGLPADVRHKPPTLPLVLAELSQVMT